MRTRVCLAFCAALMLSATHLALAAEGPFGGTPAPIPGVVQAENYDTGGQGVAYNVLTVNGTDHASRTDEVHMRVTTDTVDGLNMGWAAAG